jgi:hypothetical protein
MKKSILYFIFFFIIVSANAQYDRALGIRAGASHGLVFKNFIGARTAMDGWFTFNGDGIILTGLVDYHTKNHNYRIEIANLAFYVGGGIYGTYITNPSYGGKRNKFGLAGNIGVEYALPYMPFIIDLDATPRFVLINHDPDKYNDLDFDFGISLRYTF